MRILIIGSKKSTNEPEVFYSNYQKFFTGALQGNSTVNYTLIDDLIISVGDENFNIYDSRSNAELKEYQLILILGSGFKDYFDVLKTISSYGIKNDIRVINDHSGNRSGSKLQQAVQFYDESMLVAKTVYVTSAALENEEKIGITFPCIMKATIAAHGEDNYLVRSIEEARKISIDNDKKKFVLQRFIPNDGDYRLLLVGDEMLVIKRTATSDTHLNNTSQGGSAEIMNEKVIPQYIIELSKNIAKKLGMTFAGVDVLADKNTGTFYFLEINRQPQLMSGAFVEEKQKLVAKFFADKL